MICELSEITQYTSNEGISVSRMNTHYHLDTARKASKICLQMSEKTIFKVTLVSTLAVVYIWCIILTFMYICCVYVQTVPWSL